MSFDRAVVRLILKKTSLLLSVTLMLRCSDLGWSSALPPAPGDWSRSDISLWDFSTVVVYFREQRRDLSW